MTEQPSVEAMTVALVEKLTIALEAAEARAQKAEALRAEASTQLTQVCGERDRARAVVEAARKAENDLRIHGIGPGVIGARHVLYEALAAYDEPPMERGRDE